MTTRLVVLRPRPAVRSVPFSRPSSSRPSSSRSSSSGSSSSGSSSSGSSVPSSGSSWVPVVVEWDAVRGLHVARCARCADCFTSSRVDQVEDWAASHRCDAELAALLAEISGWAA
ncbi:hypothetical protein [Actinomadura sp. NBRC 104425]|uniref:hypothetical protein n=1 Tax=Actinomadura sp. NBRC 104425 TaxID=3032204 RepID=UPI0025549FD9|nr:hypothetical protein [Actinomadura sp. NBRC 104425]